MILWRTVASLVFAASALTVGLASAQDEWKEDGGEKPPSDDAHPPKKKEAPPAEAEQKPSRVLLDVKLGPAFLLSSSGVTDFGIQLNFAYGIAHDLATKGDTFWLGVSPYMFIGEDAAFVAPISAQYDLPLKVIPYDGISAYARVSAGYAYHQLRGLKIDQGYHGFAVQPALGMKVALFDRFHVGIEPFAFDIVHTYPPYKKAGPEETTLAYQIYVFAGAHF